MTDFTKQPSEQFPIAFEYFGNLPFGATIVSGTASAYNVTDSSEATDDVIQSTDATIVGTQARVGIEGGTDGKTYKITCTVTLSDGSILEDEATVGVVET